MKHREIVLQILVKGLFKNMKCFYAKKKKLSKLIRYCITEKQFITNNVVGRKTYHEKLLKTF